jgi:hypothetical protein
MITIDRFIDSFYEQMKNPTGCYPLDNITGMPIHNKTKVKEYFKKIWSYNFTALINNFLAQMFFSDGETEAKPGFVLISNYDWDDIKQPSLVNFHLLKVWDNAQTKQ